MTPGQIIDGKYRVGRLIGEGGMGSVYEGENLRIGRRVAIKVLHPEVSSRLHVVDRFVQEARAAAKIGSVHIADVLDLGDLPGGESFIVMEFLEGENLEDRARRGRMDPLELAQIAVQLLEGLAQVHDAGIVHRDLKPENVFLARGKGGDTVKVLDFGVSKFQTPLGMSTDTGAIVGTPFFMAPEQARGSNKEIDARTDIYAVGVILYRCAAGHVPFEAANFHELLFKIVLEAPTPLEVLVPGIDPGFVALVVKAMAREPANRFQTARELQRAVLDWSGLELPVVPAIDGSYGSVPRAVASMRPRSPMSESVLPSSNTKRPPPPPARTRRSAAFWGARVALGAGLLGLVGGFASVAVTRRPRSATVTSSGALVPVAPPFAVATEPDAAPVVTSLVTPTATPPAPTSTITRPSRPGVPRSTTPAAPTTPVVAASAAPAPSATAGPEIPPRRGRKFRTDL